MKSPFCLSTTACAKRFTLCLLAIFFLSGCGLIQGMQEPPEEEEPKDNQPTKNDPNGEEENACGGDEELSFDGEVADRGDPCGPCDRDTLRCDENDEEGNTLVCEPGGTPCEGPQSVEATTDLVDEVVVSWDHVEGADEYVIYRDGDEIGTTTADGAQKGDILEFADEDASLATPVAPENFEASRGDATDSIELSWEFDEETMLPDGDAHQYAVVAVYDEFEDGDSAPVEVTGHTVGTFGDDYQFRRDGGDWISFSNPTCQNHKCQHSDEEDGDGGPNLPEVEAGSVVASEGAAGYEVTVEVMDAHGLVTPTEYELRAVTESSVEGNASTATGHLGVEELTAQLQRAEKEDADDQNFADVGETKILDVAFDDEDDIYSVVEPTSFFDTPPDEEAYFYRVAVWPHSHDEQIQFSESDRGQRGEPRLYTTSDDDTLRAVAPTGDEVWDQSGFIHGIVFLATDPAGNVYATGDDPKNSVLKYDFNGNKQWEFDEPEEPVNYVATSPEGYVYATSGSRVYRINEDDETQFDYFEDADGRKARGVVADADGYVYVAFHPVEDDEENGDNGDDYAIYSLQFSDDFDGSISVQWSLPIEEQPTMLIPGGDGYVYWGTMRSTVHRVALDANDPEAAKETVELPFQINVMGLTITPDGDLYIGGYDSLGGPTGHVKGVDFDSDGSYQAVPHAKLDNLAVNQVATDPEGHLYYATTSEYGDTDRHERVFKLDEDYEEVWVFEGHVTADGIFTDVRDIIVTPGFYGTFPDAWHDIQDQLD